MRTRNLILLPLVVLGLSACEKEITVDLPKTEQKLVVEGTIEPGQPPIVLLTRTESYFDPLDASTFSNLFVRNAVVTVSDGITTLPLSQLCSSAIPDSLIDEVAELTGLDPDLLAAADICLYSTLDPALFGVVGRTYHLDIQAEGKSLSSSTTIPNPVPLDSLWFRLDETIDDNDSLGYIWTRLTDPDTVGNNYRWSARRISTYDDGSVKDASFIAPLGSTFNDDFFNGLSFDFFALRGSSPFSTADDDDNEERNYFKREDTVVVKFISLGAAEYEFYRTFESNVLNSGDLFASPANVRSNIQGGLGVWAGLGVAYDTLVCIPVQ